MYGNIIIDGGFYGCTALDDLSISGDNITFKDYSFSSTKLSQLRLTGNNLRLEGGSFTYCENLVKVFNLGKFNIIEVNAFQNLKITEFNLGSDSVWDVSSVHFRKQ